MTVLYFDSSAFVKLLVNEEGSDLASDVWDGNDVVLSSRLAYPEVRSALASASRTGRFELAALRDVNLEWESYWRETRPIELTARVARHAGALAQAYRLSGADAVHLASALAIGTPELIVAVWDVRLRAGVRAEGLRLVPASV
ncbi:MAG: type II toxin-antitoxin system VapC family toxin [Acidimicrobiales bacterium]